MSEEQLIQLEEKLAYQEATIQSLSETVYRQERMLSALGREVRTLGDRLGDRLAEMQPAQGEASEQGEQSNDEVPPHY